MVLELKGQERGRWELAAQPSGEAHHDFAAPDAPVAPPPAPVRVAPLVVTGVGVATLVAASVVGIVALGKIGDLESKCPNNACPPASFADDVADTRTFVTATDVLFVAGGLITAAGLGWFLFSAPSSQPRATASCGPHGCFGAIRVGFR
jgi:hypothetical protein